MTTFQEIKSNFKFLEENFDFKIINEETTKIFDLDFQYEIVSYMNRFVQIEIGKGDGLVGSEIGLEIRKLKNGIPVEYNHSNGVINLEELRLLSQKLNHEKRITQTSGFENVSKLLKLNIIHLTTKDWFNEKIVEQIKINTRVKRDEKIKEIQKQNMDFLKSKGFDFIKSNDTISSFEYWNAPFIIFSNGKEELTIKDETDVRTNYFYYHIYLTNREMEAVSTFHIEGVIHKIRELVK